jgi:predicted Zn-dependent protease
MGAILDAALARAFGSGREPIRFIQIGGNDGVMEDPLYPHHVQRSYDFQWGHIFEPIPEYFELLVANMKVFSYVNCHKSAVDDGKMAGIRAFNFISLSAVKAHGLPPSSRGLGSFSVDRNGLGGLRYSETKYQAIKEHIQQIQVRTVPVRQLISDYCDANLLLTDCEGYDIDIISAAFESGKFLPAVVQFEHLGRSEDRFRATLCRLQELGYEVTRTSKDVVCERCHQSDSVRIELATLPAMDGSLGVSPLAAPNKAQLTQVRDLLSRGRCDEALQAVEDLRAEYGAAPATVLLHASVLIARGETAECMQVLADALTRNPGDAKIMAMYRTLAFEQEDYTRAAEISRQILANSPHDRKSQIFLVRCEIGRGNFAAAADIADTFLRRSPDASVLLLRAEALVADKRADEALALLSEYLPHFAHNTEFLSHARYLASRGHIGNGLPYARRLAELDPANFANRVFLIKADLMLGDFAQALAGSNELSAECPDDTDLIVTRAQALAGLDRVDEALEVLQRPKHQETERMLSTARDLAFRHGRFAKAAELAEALATLRPSPRNRELLVQTLMAAGQTDSAKRFLVSEPADVAAIGSKPEFHFRQYERLKNEAPMLVEAWARSLRNGGSQSDEASTVPASLRLIQYWSQGRPPPDVMRVVDRWRKLLETEELGDLQLHDRSSAEQWIGANAPEFSQLFADAFHFAMESDIFRIAYASRLQCVYVDIDSWPLENTAAILRHAGTSFRSLLYFRAYRPWIVNGFFVAQPGCPFFAQLVKQSLQIDLTTLPKNHKTIDETFGPSRYNKVLRELISAADCVIAEDIPAPGCSMLSLDGHSIAFSHDAAVAAVKPPFRLSYVGTNDHWKRVSVDG